MTSARRTTGPGSADEMLACDFLLGLLRDPVLAATNHRIARDAVFAALVEEWRARLSGDAPDLPLVDPSDDVWNKISAATKK